MSPRGIPSSGTRKPGSGRKKKYNSELVQKWIPLSLADKLDDIYLLLIDLEKEVSTWEKICEEKSTSPRYEQARKLVTTLRTLLNRLGIDSTKIYADTQGDNHDDKPQAD
ncbi:hypothetical protein [Nostoc sp. 'Peltigera membranacea cyanobiont' 232]|uniref:hypothetical protein n=1 Tax=Nostoc sp. 'Peltigera membranacea cyanobiont' 232 TaxID=2014531 RepID=UPI000B950D96|nr:hypothetical protein [Nostoc sp. 'Peltigera membranacea cyanobiont' 232]OYE02134.1 hypothetical protein CDG79_25535 [Nostoc sp. 'Peltigera membranacea cyanobiont' 232]